ncbi:STAS domain-containing protein [Streptomyces sp. NPDC001288]|uniref:STAS domain-containing protein n=1 Tax=Streptomyces sp. NPDC001297 TaxID=3364559 RepID=UPI0036C3B109
MNSASGGEERPPDPTTAPTGSLPHVTQEAQGDAWVVTVVGAFDLNSVSALSAALETGVRTHSTVVVDASGLTFADSTVLNLLLHFHRKAVLRVASPASPLARVLALTGADRVLDVRPTVADSIGG